MAEYTTPNDASLVGKNVKCSWNNGYNNTSSALLSAIKADRTRFKDPPLPDNMAIERANLLAVCKLIIKSLIDLSLSQGCLLDGEDPQMLQLLTVMESILCHGLKPRKGLLRDTQRHDCWQFLEQFCHFWPGIMTSIRDLSNIRTSLGRMRVWLRLAIMQKTLADYFKGMTECSHAIILDYYEPRALMASDEAAVVAGLLVGLNIVDYNIVIKDDDLGEQPIGVIDYSLYLKEIQSAIPSHEGVSETDNEIAAIIDQKNYLEEYNRNLSATVAKLGHQVESLKDINRSTQHDVCTAHKTLSQLRTETAKLLCENNALRQGHQLQAQVARLDIETERETYKRSQRGLDVFYQNMKHQLETETEVHQTTLEKLRSQVTSRQEMESTLRLLEKDIQVKTDLLLTLRNELDEMKQVNLELQNRLNCVNNSVQFKTDVAVKLELKLGQLASTIENIEVEKKRILIEKDEKDELIKALNVKLADADVTRSLLEAELKVEKGCRSTLQQALDKKKLSVGKLQTEVQQLIQLEKEHQMLQLKYQELKHRFGEQEQALGDLGSNLSQSKLKVEDLKEAHLVLKDAQWTEDKEVTNCRQCIKAFSVSRRKHHCRSCGEIFCNECSMVKMQLASSSKPVRVCDGCRTTALQHRYSVN